MIACPPEAELLEAIAAHGGAWRTAVAPDVQAHVDGCLECRDLALVALALHDDEACLTGAAQLPSAGLVWWRATIRARLEAARSAERPLAFAPGAAAATLTGAGIGLGGVLWRLLPSSPQVTIALVAAAVIVVSPLILVIALARD